MKTDTRCSPRRIPKRGAELARVADLEQALKAKGRVIVKVRSHGALTTYSVSLRSRDRIRIVRSDGPARVINHAAMDELAQTTLGLAIGRSQVFAVQPR